MLLQPSITLLCLSCRPSHCSHRKFAAYCFQPAGLTRILADPVKQLLINIKNDSAAPKRTATCLSKNPFDKGELFIIFKSCIPAAALTAGMPWMPILMDSRITSECPVMNSRVHALQTDLTYSENVTTSPDCKSVMLIRVCFFGSLFVFLSLSHSWMSSGKCLITCSTRTASPILKMQTNFWPPTAGRNSTW